MAWLEVEDRVYPRVCGGTYDIADDGTVTNGLSPRVRGNHFRFNFLRMS